MLRRLRIENLVLIREAELSLAPGLNALTGETGAGKTILAQAIGLLLGSRGDAAVVGAAAEEAYVEAELEVPEGFLDDDELATLAELRPDGESGLVLARRIFPDGRTRTYAWGRAIAREDAATAAERLIAMSGQFEQRRLARASYQLDVLDAFCGSDQLARRHEARAAWRELVAARNWYEELSRDAESARARLAELAELVEDTDGLEAGEEGELRVERERIRHVAELGAGASAAAHAIDPDDGDGAAALLGGAERALVPLEALAPELTAAAGELRELSVRLQEVGSDLRRFVSGLEADPERLEEVEGRLQRWADLRRRYGAQTAAELIERRDGARGELDALAGGRDPIEAAHAVVTELELRCDALAGELRAARVTGAPDFEAAVGSDLRDVGMGEGEFRVELNDRELGPAGRDRITFMVRPNQGLPLAPVAETASGGELSRIALAIAAAGGGETLVFDEIDAGIGGVTAHKVAAVLRRLAERAQVLTITHLPQIASVADSHFRVEKVPGDPTHARIESLDDDGRQEELERMLGGEEFLATVARGGDAQ